MKKIFEKIMPPKTGLAVEMKDKQYMRITDIEGGQVVDVVLFNRHNLRETLSTSWSRQRKLPKTPGHYEPSDMVTEGDYLKSSLCRPMMTVIKDTPEPKGVHSTHGRMCNRWMYEMHGVDSRDGCFEIISKAIAPYGIQPEEIPNSICFFMNYVHIPEEHRWEIRSPVSKAGDYVELRAEMDLLVAISNCPEDVLSMCNNKHCKPMKIEVFEGEA